MNFLKKLQSKPLQTKKMIIFLIVTFFSLILILIWIFQTKNLFSKTKIQMPKIEGIQEEIERMKGEIQKIKELGQENIANFQKLMKTLEELKKIKE